MKHWILVPVIALVVSGCGSEDNSSTTATLQLPEQSLSDSAAEPLPVSRDAVSYAQLWDGISPVTQTVQQQVSDEYWTEVSGAELNRGVALPLSQGGSLIRVAPRWNLDTGTPIKGESVVPSSIELRPVGDKQAQPNLVESMADADALATAGIDDGSSALVLSASLKPGAYRLKVNQSLMADAKYLVHVKEKHSPWTLSLASPARVAAEQTSLPVELTLSGSDDAEIVERTASLRLSTGENIELAFSGSEGQPTLAVSGQTLPLPGVAPDELVVTSLRRVDGQEVKRTVKTAVKRVSRTLSLAPQITSHWGRHTLESLELKVQASAQGRYQITLWLEGTDSSGNWAPAYQLQAARWLEPGQHAWQLPLVPDLLAKQGLTPPYRLATLTLTDQSRMAPLLEVSPQLVL
ncbi:DUF4785 domain-containing protein [Ferrimonas sp. YFM]|uniref:DUF4785 domain-containing protein n=1 Tax=Ferrimonas sp. YFM TaxID=3028878 RepID=UPI00257474A4|nr:DUF4785 domain-containing protein [Ferrimonas sp. YFM]BDY04952.1 DUF4785 domain-containing protein [Ferrimonas sp. YFM]